MSYAVLDSGFHALDSGFQVPHPSLCQWNMDPGFLELYPDYKTQRNSLGFRIPQVKISGITEFGFPYMGER